MASTPSPADNDTAPGADVAVAHSSDPAVAAHPPVDPQAEPSAQWGWHGELPRATAFAGWFSAFALFMMLIGNHVNPVEDYWLIGLGTLLVALLIGGQLRKRAPWRR